MSVAAAQVVCPSNAGTQIVPALNATVDGSAVQQFTRRTINIVNFSAQTVYLGGDNTVTSATGFPLLAGATITLQLGLGDAVFGRGASASPTVAYIEAGV